MFVVLFYFLFSLPSCRSLPLSLLPLYTLSPFLAMIAGVPVVAFDEGGGKEYLQNMTNCVIPSSGSAKDIAASVLLLKRDEALRKRIGGAGRDFVIKHRLTRTAMVEDYQWLYERLVGEKDHLTIFS